MSALTIGQLHELAVHDAEHTLAAYVAARGGHQAIGWTPERFDEECAHLTAVIARHLEAIDAPGPEDQLQALWHRYQQLNNDAVYARTSDAMRQARAAQARVRSDIDSLQATLPRNQEPTR